VSKTKPLIFVLDSPHIGRHS